MTAEWAETATLTVIIIVIAASFYQYAIIWPIVLRLLRKNRISYLRWDRGTNAAFRFLRMAADEPRPSRRKVYQKLRQRLLLGYALYLAAWVLGATVLVPTIFRSSGDTRSHRADAQREDWTVSPLLKAQTPPHTP
ncbi:hypothetical protein [Longimicrobium terrae]|uniref:Uncharacterized protein n=1 Tax=Longimicrobium terrae TaxID=1639882 RepID=A0A841H749_9BACT|nr:hypothetical protein [Longimicrobium terrae]MBB4638276.1 hypothetical protein [Longimicrobium terrae]MBB6073754.1 hypothetical protein [Longimicrobium terrae]NNC30247.1 hypothetical protein [Longimicrobium terrae]